MTVNLFISSMTQIIYIVGNILPKLFHFSFEKFCLIKFFMILLHKKKTIKVIFRLIVKFYLSQLIITSNSLLTASFLDIIKILIIYQLALPKVSITKMG